MPTLRLKLPQQGEVTHELTTDRVTIGRRPDNTIQIIDRSVSAHHAELILENGHYRLHDLGSTNLSFVEGEPVMDFHLHQACKVAFGTIQCEFDPHAGTAEPRLTPAEMDKDIGFLQGENIELQSKIVALQRQIDILSSARLVTKKADTAPFAAHNDSYKAVVSERDDLRHLSSGLKLELEQLRGELTATINERDAARQACDLLQAEKGKQEREMQELREQLGAAGIAPAPATTTTGTGLTVIEETQSPRRPVWPAARQPSGSSAAAETCSTQRITLPLPAQFDLVFRALLPVQTALISLTAKPSETNALAELATYASQLVDATSQLGDHPISRLGHSIEALLQDFANRSEPPDSAQIQTLSQATELMARLLDPRNLNCSPPLAHPRVFTVDDDADLIQSLTASLELAQTPHHQVG